MNLRQNLDRLRSPEVLVCVVLVIMAGGFVASRLPEDSSSQARVEMLDSKTHPKASATRRDHSVRRVDDAYDGGVGFVVPYRPDCPPGTERRGGEPPAEFKEWCARVGRDQDLKHGWYAEWYPDGRPSRSGAYEEGLRVGVWTRWYPNGKKRVQAEFERGLQHGKLISWDQDGRQLGEQLFRDGSVVKRSPREPRDARPHRPQPHQ